MLAHQALDLFRGEPFRRSLLHHPPGMIDEPMRFFDVREGSPFCRFGNARLQRPDDLSLKPSRLLVEKAGQTLRPRHRHRFPGQVVGKREAKFEAVCAALDVFHPSHQSMVP